MAMRKTVLLLMIMASALVVASGIAWARTIDCPNRSGNVCVGSKKSDTMTGTESADDMRGRKGGDQMFGLGGNDKFSGGGGVDVMRGGPGSDTMDGNNGRDEYYGEEGNDKVYSAGAFGDYVDCGPDTDVAVVDSRDKVVNCEEVREVSP
jgi:Ca2+-binding RTX toxin-like protein